MNKDQFAYLNTRIVELEAALNTSTIAEQKRITDALMSEGADKINELAERVRELAAERNRFEAEKNKLHETWVVERTKRIAIEAAVAELTRERDSEAKAREYWRNQWNKQTEAYDSLRAQVAELREALEIVSKFVPRFTHAFSESSVNGGRTTWLHDYIDAALAKKETP